MTTRNAAGLALGAMLLALACAGNGPLRAAYAPDEAAARRAGIASAGMTQEETLRAIAADLERRLALRVADTSVGAQVAVEEGGAIVARIGGSPWPEAALLRADADALELPRFLAVAEDGDLAPQGTSVAQERARLAAWLEAHPSAPLAAFRELRREDGGPLPRLLWAERSAWPVDEGDVGDEGDGAAAETGAARARGALPLLVPEDPAEDFRADDFAEVEGGKDDLGYPALSFSLRRSRWEAFRRFTARLQGKQMAVVLRGRVAMAPTVNSPLPGNGIVGRIGEDELRELLAELAAVPIAAAVRQRP